MQEKLLNKLSNGKTVYGTCITSLNPIWGKIARGAQLDFVFLDTEHITLERMEIAAMCQLYNALGIAPIVRIPSPDPYRACQILDAGAEGIVAPYVENMQQVKEMVGALKYKPLKGERLSELLADPESVDPVLESYLSKLNAGNLCIINIESVPAVERLEELLSVPGLDAVFIGPHDLSVSMNIPEQYDHPEFEKTVELIIKQCRSKGIAVGIHFSESPDRQVKWKERGANIIIHSSDLAIFSQQLKRDLDLIRGTGEEKENTSGDLII